MPVRAAPSSRARSTDPRDYQRVARPFAAMAKSFTDGFEIEPHSHQRDQLIYAVSGLMRVRTERNAWIVPPDRAVYLPARTIHSISMRGDVEMRTLYIARDAAGVAFSGEVASGSPQKTRQLKDILPAGPTVMAVSRLLRELVLALVDEPLLYDQAGRGGAIVSLIVSEIARAQRSAARHPDAARSAVATRLRTPARRPVGPAHARWMVARLRAPPRGRSRACSTANWISPSRRGASACAFTMRWKRSPGTSRSSASRASMATAARAHLRPRSGPSWDTRRQVAPEPVHR